MNHKRLYVGDLAPGVTEEELHELFHQIDQVDSVNLVRSPTHQLHGFAFVEMVTPEAARQAVSRYNGFSLRGSRLIVYTVPPKSRPRTLIQQPN